MDNTQQPHYISRRAFLWRFIAVPTAAFLAACSPQSLEQALSAVAANPPSSGALPPTPSCGDDDDPTPAQTAGPFYTPNSPLRTSLLEEGIVGARMLLTGYVLDTACRPLVGALVDFWHADANGNYDNVGYRLRGHQFTDDQGRYTLETIVPGLYPGRTRHFHVKVQAPNQPILTTQLYFPDEPTNARDGIYRPDLEITMVTAMDGVGGVFNFVLELV